MKDPCMECGMLVSPAEYHPYAACLMFKSCHDSATVQANLDAVIAYGLMLDAVLKIDAETMA